MRRALYEQIAAIWQHYYATGVTSILRLCPLHRCGAEIKLYKVTLPRAETSVVKIMGKKRMWSVVLVAGPASIYEATPFSKRVKRKEAANNCPRILATLANCSPFALWNG